MKFVVFPLFHHYDFINAVDLFVLDMMMNEHDLSPRPQAQTLFVLLARVDAKFIVEINIACT